MKKGDAYSLLKDYKKAIQYYDRSIEIDFSNPSVFFNRGLAYFSISDYKNAIINFDKAIKIDPSNNLIFAKRSEAYCKLEEYEYWNEKEKNPKKLK
jgi:tetratricopeptide (TPR) repeat protein